MEAEDDWSPPWDCDSDNETNYYDYTNASMKVNVSSPFKNTLNEPYNDSSTEDEQQMSSTKKKLKFDEIETEMEEIHPKADWKSNDCVHYARKHKSQ